MAGHRFVVKPLEFGDLGGVLEIFPHVGRGGAAHRFPELWRGDELIETGHEAVFVAFGHQYSGLLLTNGFGDTAVQSGDHGQTGGHGFEHGIRNPFLILIGCHLAWMHEDMGLMIEVAQAILIKKPGEPHLRADVEFADEVIERGSQRSFTGDGKAGLRTSGREARERAERDLEAFFLDQAAGLHEVPSLSDWTRAVAKRKRFEGDASAIEAHFFGIGAEGDHAFPQRFRSDEDQRDFLKQGAQTGLIARAVGAGLHVHAMKTDHRGPGPAPQKRQQMDPGVTEINMQQVGLMGRQHSRQCAVLATVHDWRFVPHVFQPRSPEEIRSHGRRNDGFIKWKPFSLKSFLANDKCLPPAQTGDLPVDVQHLGLEEGGAITGDARHGKMRPVDHSVQP